MKVVFISGILMELLTQCASDETTRMWTFQENQLSGPFRRNYIIRHQEHKSGLVGGFGRGYSYHSPGKDTPPCSVAAVRVSYTVITGSIIINIRLKPYRPDHGYEPFWPDSDWVFSRHETTTQHQVVTCTTIYCPKIYQKFGEMCARNDKYEHKTFDNYCAWKNLDCGHQQKWFIVYRGKCAGELKTYPNTWSVLITRAEEYIKRFNESLTSTARTIASKTRRTPSP